MNEQDKEAFEKWYETTNLIPAINVVGTRTFSFGELEKTWQAALEYERRDSSIKIAQAQAVAIQERERSKKLAEADAKIDELKQQVIDYETDWLKMRKYYDGAKEKMKMLDEAIGVIDDFVMTGDHADFCGGDKWSECTCMDRNHFNPESNIKRSIEFLEKIKR